uniref:Uncharacterized protein n=1 Tax=Meloidogyne floridensis TaxID=298350 RepID=A0A915NG35_9BILA
MFSKILLVIILLQLVFDAVNTQEEGDNVEIGPPIVVAQPPIATTECAHRKNKNGGKDHKGGKGVFKRHKGTKKPKKNNKEGKKTTSSLMN